tara:strand:- start:26 stop:529 length:504 start_codon:yes stop_codon:yes gene_type:complete
MKPYQRVAYRHLTKQPVKIVPTDVFVDRDSTHAVMICVGLFEVGYVEGRLGLYTLEEISRFVCSEDILSLYELWGDDAGWGDEIPIFEVLESDIFDEDFRSQGLGLQMYKELGNLARSDSRLPMFFIPNYCYSNKTSDKALRVWKSLARSNPVTSDDVILMIDRKLR